MEDMLLLELGYCVSEDEAKAFMIWVRETEEILKSKSSSFIKED